MWLYVTNITRTSKQTREIVRVLGVHRVADPTVKLPKEPTPRRGLTLVEGESSSPLLHLGTVPSGAVG